MVTLKWLKKQSWPGRDPVGWSLSTARKAFGSECLCLKLGFGLRTSNRGLINKMDCGQSRHVNASSHEKISKNAHRNGMPWVSSGRVAWEPEQPKENDSPEASEPDREAFRGCPGHSCPGPGSVWPQGLQAPPTKTHFRLWVSKRTPASRPWLLRWLLCLHNYNFNVNVPPTSLNYILLITHRLQMHANPPPPPPRCQRSSQLVNTKQNKHRETEE